MSDHTKGPNPVPRKSVPVEMTQGEVVDRQALGHSMVGPGNQYMIAPADDAQSGYGYAYDKRIAYLWAVAPEMRDVLESIIGSAVDCGAYYKVDADDIKSIRSLLSRASGKGV